MLLNNIISYLKKLTIKQWLLVFIIAIAIFFRFYNLKNSLMFQGDQGRDALIVSKIFKEKDLVFIGPVTSVGNMYLGPLYYYFMLPFLFLSYPSPIGPAYGVAALGVITVYLIYKLGKEMIGEKAALFAAFMFSISATVVDYSRFSWNPNPAPFVSLLMIYFTYKAWHKDSKNWFFVIVCFSILIQLHYLTLLSATTAGIIWITQLVQLIKSNKSKSPKNESKQKLTKFIKHTFLASLIFLVPLVPLVLFDIKHGAKNLKAFSNLVLEKENFSYSMTTSFLEKTITTIKETDGRAMHILFEYNIGKMRSLNRFLSWSMIISIIYLLTKTKNKQQFRAKTTIFIYLITGIIGTSFYQHTVFDHYISYLFPVTFLIYGMVFSLLYKKIIGKIILAVFSIYFIFYNIQNMPIKSLGWTIDDIKRTSDAILERIGPNDEYNIVLLSESNDHYGLNYRYFLHTGKTEPLKLEDAAKAKKLVIIDEEKKKVDLANSPIYAIAVFTNKNVIEKFEIKDGPKITILGE